MVEPMSERLGFVLDAEQKLCLNDVLATDGDGRLAAYRAGISMPRQSPRA